MSALPFDPFHTYTVDEFASLPEDVSARYEMVEGSIVVSPRPDKRHMNAALELACQFRAQVPAGARAMLEVDVDLQLRPSTIRVPDLVIVRDEAMAKPGLVTAADVLLAVEIISPGSVRTDTKVKPLEYADAGIPHLWLIDPEAPVTATILTLIGEDYEESQRAEHQFTVTDPFPLTVDLDALLS